MASRERRSGCGRVAIGCGGATLVLLLGLCVLGGYAYHLWHRQPEGWTRALAAQQQMSPEVRRQVAISLENRLARELSFTPENVDAYTRGASPGATSAAPPPAIEKTLRVEVDEINAWLAERLRPWAEHQGQAVPAGVNDFAYWVENGLPVIAAHIEAEGVGQIVSVTLRPQIQPDGPATLSVVSVRGGELPMPLGRFREQVEGTLRSASDGDDVTRALAVLRGEPFDPVVKVRDGERVRVTAIEVTGDAIELTVRRERDEENTNR